MEDTSASRDLVAIASFLAQTRLFSNIPLSELMILAASAGVYICPAGEVIFRQGDPGGVMYLIKSGTVRIVLPIRDEVESTLLVLNPGDLFGELSLFDGGDRTATAVAQEPVESITITREDMFAFLRRRPDAAIRILGVMAARLRRTDEILGDALFRNAR
ncbi:MAG: Catabolite activator [Dehalococcoidia bacterium]|nr:Catabolite activator [Dehalococcoidia bacterium]